MDANEKIGLAKRRLLVRSPFWGTVILNTPIQLTKDVPTAGTDGKTIYINPDFLAELNVAKTEFLLAHEAAHILFMTALRLRHRQKEKWNDAEDYVINHLLVEDGMTFIEGGLLDARYTSSGELVYEMLPDEPRNSGGIGRDLLPANMTDIEAQAHAQKIRQVVTQAATVARMAGKMSAGLERMVGDILQPKVPWADVLRDFMQAATRDNETWSRRNRRFSEVYLPDLYDFRMGSLCAIGDVSGSISADNWVQVLSEVVDMAERTRPEVMRLVAADTRVTADVVLDRDAIRQTPITGGGGTDMRVPLKYVEQYRPDVVVLLTDGYTPWPNREPPYPLIVCCTTDVDVPVGRVVRMHA